MQTQTLGPPPQHCSSSGPSPSLIEAGEAGEMGETGETGDGKKATRAICPIACWRTLITTIIVHGMNTQQTC